MEKQETALAYDPADDGLHKVQGLANTWNVGDRSASEVPDVLCGNYYFLPEEEGEGR